MECIRLQICNSTSLEVRQHDNIQHVSRCETFLTANVEQCGNFAQTVNVQAHLERSIADKLLVSECLVSGQSSALLSVVLIQKIYSSDTSLTSSHNCLRTLVIQVIVDSFSNHVINGTHNQRVHLDGHRLLNSVVKHGQETVKLCRIGKTLLYLQLSERHRHLKSNLAVEELSGNNWLVENVLVIGFTVLQIPAIILTCLRNICRNLLQHTAKLPAVHQHGRNIAAIHTVNENDLTNVVYQRPHIAVNAGTVKNFLTNINNICQIFCNQIFLTSNLFSYGIH